jgi:CRP-like cAMP-binding protein
MRDLVDRIRGEIDSRLEELRPLAREASDLQRALDALNGVTEASAADGDGRRRRSGQRASPPRSRSARRDLKSLVVEHVAANPGSTASDVAKALGLRRSSVATRLTQLGKSGELVKNERGYSAP